LISKDRIVRGFHTELDGDHLDLRYLPDQGKIIDETTRTVWNSSGKWLQGEIKRNLVKWSVSEEYWFGWREFHPLTQVRPLKDIVLAS
jgi:hypothetical protein